MTRDEHTTNRPTPGGSAFQETGMSDYITAVEVVRDSDGYWSHPDLPDFDEDADAQNEWLQAQRLGITTIWLESERDDHPAFISYFENEDLNISAWEPTPPDGDGWFLLCISDTDDGPAACYARCIDLQAVIASVPRPEPVATMVPAGAKVWFSYDGDSGFDVHSTAEEAQQTAQHAIDEYRAEADPDDGWPEQVENVCWGVVLGKTREIEVDDGYDGSAGLADCGRPVDYVLASEPVAAQPAVPDGWKPVPVEPTHDMKKVGVEIEIGDEDRIVVATFDEVANIYRAMLAATPVAPQTIQCNACNWIGSSADAHYLGGREPIGPLCPECHETTGPANDAAKPEAPEPVLDRPASIGGTTFGVGIPVRTLVAAAQRRYEVEQTPASLADRQALIDALRRPVVDAEIATLRSAIRAMASMLQAREWAEHVSAAPDVTDLEVQITELVGTATKLREQNAALVAALTPFAFISKEGVVTITKNYVTVTTCAEYFNRAEKVLAALASAKGGA